MDAFFESPKHTNTNPTGGPDTHHQDTVQSQADEQLNRQLDMNQTTVVVDSTEQATQQPSEQQQIQYEIIDQSQTTSHSTQQLTELTNADMSQHVKLEMENGQVVVVDPSQLETVVLVAANGTDPGGNAITVDSGGNQLVANGNEIIIQQNSDGTTTMLLDSSSHHHHQDQHSLLVTSNALGLVDNDDSNQMDDEADTSMKEIDDTLAMSPGFASSLGGSVSQGYMLNGNNVSTHTFRKTEWDVKKLENYVRASFGDATPMEGMDPAKMNYYLVSFFKLAKKSDGMDYEPESLIGFMNSFERYLKTKNYPESLLRSETFKESRTELKKKRDLVRSIGKLIRTKTKDTCYLLQFHRNLLKEKGLLNRDNPDCLLAEIYLNNMIYFGEFLKEDKAWRGNLNLVWGDMLLERDPTNGLEYLTLATYAKKSSRNQTNQANNTTTSQQQSPVAKTTSRTKTGTQTSKLRAAVAAAAALAAANPSINSQSDINSPRVYARQPASYCPIEAYKMYKSRRPNNCLDRDSPFYLAPLFKSKNQSKVWYKALAMSCQRLDALFYCLFKKAGVDLASLASMSQQQQQQAVAAAASIINSNGTPEPMPVVTDAQTGLSQWKSAMKENQMPAEDMNDLLLNGKHTDLHATVATAATFSHQPAQQTQTHHSMHHTNQQQQHQHQQQNIVYTSQTATGHQQHHIVTTVPAQVQVQVQVQVQIPQHQQQQQHANSNQQQMATALIV